MLKSKREKKGERGGVCTKILSKGAGRRKGDVAVGGSHSLAIAGRVETRIKVEGI